MISSTSNNRIKEVVQLKNKAKARRDAGLFVVEGLRLTGEAPVERVSMLYLTEAFLSEHPESVEGRPYETVTENVLKAMCDTQTPQGILGVIRMQETSFEEMCRGKEAPLLLILENLQDPGNLGTILRTAEAAGVDGILMSRDTVDIYNPKVVRSTMGAIFRMPFAYTEDLSEALADCARLGIRTYAAHLQGKNSYDREDYRTGTAFLIGNEGNGLTEAISDAADIRIRIPMAGKAESLNASVAASLLAYEAARQREFK